MKHINIDSDLEYLDIHPISDIHLGHKKCNFKLYLKTLDKIVSNRKHSRILLLGDLIECATKSSVGKGVYDESLNTNEQLRLLKSTLTPFKDIIDGAVTGNHEMRVTKDTSIDITENLCESLDLNYLGYSGIISYNLNDISYDIFIWHGSGGGGRRPGSSINRLEDMAHITQADVYLMGHTHRLIFYHRDILTKNRETSELFGINQVFVNTGGYLDWSSNYSEQNLMTLTKLGSPVIRLHSSQKKIEVII